MDAIYDLRLAQPDNNEIRRALRQFCACNIFIRGGGVLRGRKERYTSSQFDFLLNVSNLFCE